MTKQQPRDKLPTTGDSLCEDSALAIIWAVAKRNAAKVERQRSMRIDLAEEMCHEVVAHLQIKIPQLVYLCHEAREKVWNTPLDHLNSPFKLLKPDARSLESWLYAVANNRCIDFVRKYIKHQRRHVLSREDWGAEAVAPTDSPSVQGTDSVAVEKTTLELITRDVRDGIQKENILRLFDFKRSRAAQPTTGEMAKHIGLGESQASDLNRRITMYWILAFVHETSTDSLPDVVFRNSKFNIGALDHLCKLMIRHQRDPGSWCCEVIRAGSRALPLTLSLGLRTTSDDAKSSALSLCDGFMALVTRTEPSPHDKSVLVEFVPPEERPGLVSSFFRCLLQHCRTSKHDCAREIIATIQSIRDRTLAMYSESKISKYSDPLPPVEGPHPQPHDDAMESEVGQ